MSSQETDAPDNQPTTGPNHRSFSFSSGHPTRDASERFKPQRQKHLHDLGSSCQLEDENQTLYQQSRSALLWGNEGQQYEESRAVRKPCVHPGRVAPVTPETRERRRRGRSQTCGTLVEVQGPQDRRDMPAMELIEEGRYRGRCSAPGVTDSQTSRLREASRRVRLLEQGNEALRRPAAL